MSTWHGSLLLLFWVAAASYGGWRGGDVWSGWGIWCLLLPPLAWGALKTVGEWRWNPYWVFIKIGLVMTAVAVVTIGGQALVLAWLVAEATAPLSPEPAVRALVGGGSVAAAGALVLIALPFGPTAHPGDPGPPANPDGAPERPAAQHPAT
jgi:hypothetical protein